ncbi:unnamed protein product [Rotaria socialis]|uniref:Uncharacterized protein n=1 Tax=Rotaria socialis TaxID=392032 RepID=A0A818WAE3_9BILA|nr:unnamed protein product [Rotaria socialis]CAF3434413.1 unnamed protein product [Rotaria socialis]CAF3721796.1 unnamed protein product [Rotaria socialis]
MFLIVKINNQSKQQIIYQASLCRKLAISSNVFVSAATTNLYPAVGSPLINKGMNRLYLVLFDCNGIDRSMSTPTIGAHEYSTTNNSSCMITNSGSSTAAVPQYLLIR